MSDSHYVTLHTAQILRASVMSGSVTPPPHPALLNPASDPSNSFTSSFCLDLVPFHLWLLFSLIQHLKGLRFIIWS